MEIGSIKLISKNLSTVFTFKLYHLKEFDDYITLHNLSMLLTFVVTLYLIHCSHYGSDKHFIVEPYNERRLTHVCVAVADLEDYK